MQRHPKTPYNKLSDLILAETTAQQQAFSQNGNPDFLAIEVCRAIDYWTTVIPDEENDPGISEFIDTLRWGYSSLISMFYNNYTNKVGFPLFSSNNVDPKHLIDGQIYYAGKLAIANQILEYHNANLISISEAFHNKFQIHYLSQATGLESFDNETLDNHFVLINEHVIEPKRKEHLKKEEEILKKMFPLVDSWKSYFIKYDTTPEIDNYFAKLGYWGMIGSQLYDSFEEGALFGGIEYKKYLDVLQDIMGTSYKHVKYCNLLYTKNSAIDPRDVLCICYRKKDLVPQYAYYLSLSEAEVSQIFDCLTVSKENIEYHVKQRKAFSPPFLQVSKTHLMKSVYGALNLPVVFLLRELKRRYQKDYFRNINAREKLLRTQLYHIIDTKQIYKERLIKIDREVRIKIENIHTDIDAVIFDKKTLSLGLFQLKWQDLYTHDMKERYSRISNLYPKANEWIEKISKLIKIKTNKEIMNILGIQSYSEINNIYLYVVNRGNTHFTGQIQDERAAWGSWYHVLELSHKVATDFDDPLRELFFKLKIDSPVNKSSIDKIQDFESKFKNFEIFYKKS